LATDIPERNGLWGNRPGKAMRMGVVGELASPRLFIRTDAGSLSASE
jgi:hypothetical protein